jgi:hypothetical protein
MKSIILLVVIILSLTTISYAGTVTVTQDAGTTFVTDAITGYSTFGDMMVGMSVSALFDDQTSQTVPWAALGPDAGGVSGTDWSLTESGDTFSSNWTLTNTSGKSITDVHLDGGPGKTIFDRTFGNVFGTPGSASGLDFQVTGGGDPFDITATYVNLVAVDGNPPVGDIFKDLDILFTNTGGFSSDHSLTFMADTDNATTAIVPVVPAPEPSTFFLLGAGLAGVGLLRRRFKG